MGINGKYRNKPEFSKIVGTGNLNVVENYILQRNFG